MQVASEAEVEAGAAPDAEAVEGVAVCGLWEADAIRWLCCIEC